MTRFALQDGRFETFTYDANGNVSTLTPPGNASHTFSYTAREEIASYSPPSLGNLDTETRLTYDADRQLTRLDRPDGQESTWQTDAAGRLDLVDLVTGQQSYVYDAASRLISLRRHRRSTSGTRTTAACHHHDVERRRPRQRRVDLR